MITLSRVIVSPISFEMFPGAFIESEKLTDIYKTILNYQLENKGQITFDEWERQIKRKLQGKTAR